MQWNRIGSLLPSDDGTRRSAVRAHGHQAQTTEDEKLMFGLHAP